MTLHSVVFLQWFIDLHLDCHICYTDLCNNSQPVTMFQYIHISFLLKSFHRLPYQWFCWWWTLTSKAAVTFDCSAQFCFEVTLHIEASLQWTQYFYCLYCTCSFHQNDANHVTHGVDIYNTGFSCKNMSHCSGLISGSNHMLLISMGNCVYSVYQNCVVFMYVAYKQ